MPWPFWIGWREKNAELRRLAMLPRRKYARIELDMGPVDRNLDRVAIETILESMFEHGVLPKDALCGENYAYARHVEISTVQKLASRMFRIVDGAMPRLVPFQMGS
jgi:hypothetical protein